VIGVENVKRFQMVRDEIKSHCEMMLRAVENCDEPEEALQLNHTLNAVRQGLQSAAATLGAVIAENSKL
jgi:hypothetical protein